MLTKLINTYIRPFWGYVVGALIGQLIAVTASLSLPNLNARIIDEGVAKGDIGYIWARGGLMLAISALQVCAQACAVFMGANAAMKLGRDIRKAVFEHTLNFSRREMNEFGAPSLITRCTNDVQQVQMLVFMTCAVMIAAPLTMIGGVVMALREDVVLSWAILVAVIVLGILVGLIVWRISPLFRAQQSKIDALNDVAREQISGVRVIRAFVREADERARFDIANTDLMKLGIRIGTLFALLFPGVFLVMNLSQVAVMWFGAHRIDSSTMQVGSLIAFLTYLIQILISVMIATIMVLMAPRASVCATRIMAVLKQESSVVWVDKPAAETDGAEVAFEDVTFSYPGAERPVLSNLTFTLKPGTTTALIGSTGAGKTTLVNLIPRLFDVSAGRITIGGLDIRQLGADQLWSKIGLVPQKPYLFSGTVASNLRYGDPQASPEEMWAALEAAQAGFVRDLDGQLEASIAQGGTNVSGGQRQRLSIARALLKKADIYIFDDAFSALDVTTDKAVRTGIKPLTRKAAVLIVAQRISTITSADQIIVLDHGRIEAIGTHAQLLETSKTYREIYSSQNDEVAA